MLQAYTHRNSFPSESYFPSTAGGMSHCFLLLPFDSTNVFRSCLLFVSQLQVFSRTEIDIFTSYVIGRAPGTWRAGPGPLKVVAIDTGAGVMQLNPEDGGVVVAMVR